jgi:actin-related protein
MPKAVIFEIGRSWTKVGFSGEATTRAVIATPPAIVTLMQTLSCSPKDVPLTDSLTLRTFLRTLFIQHLLQNSAEQYVILSYPIHSNLCAFEAMKHELLQTPFKCSKVDLMCHHALLPLALGCRAALVIDFGSAHEVRIVPVFDTMFSGERSIVEFSLTDPWDYLASSPAGSSPEGTITEDMVDEAIDAAIKQSLENVDSTLRPLFASNICVCGGNYLRSKRWRASETAHALPPLLRSWTAVSVWATLQQDAW